MKENFKAKFQMFSKDADELEQAIFDGSITKILFKDTILFVKEDIKMEFTDNEKGFLTLLFNIGNEIIEAAGGYYEINYESFDRGDLFRLAEKLKIEYD